MAEKRAQKIWRLNTLAAQSDYTAHVAIFNNPPEVRMAATPSSFIAIKEDSITLAGGQPCTINVQGMSSSMKYGGMLQDLPFPLTLIPSTTFTPFPKQIFKPPFIEYIPLFNQIAQMMPQLLKG